MDALRTVGAAEDVPLILEQPKLKAHGDLATPVALGLAKQLGKNPMAVAEAIVEAARFPRDIIASVDVVKPGFINFTFAPPVLRKNLLEILSLA